MPVFYFTSIGRGGYGFSENQISVFIGIGGLSQSIWLLLVFPKLQHRVGTGGVLRLCATVWPLWFLATPATNILLRYNLDTAFWTIAPTLLVVGSGVAMAFSTFLSSCEIIFLRKS